jgi:SRSO17 transposase
VDGLTETPRFLPRRSTLESAARTARSCPKSARRTSTERIAHRRTETGKHLLAGAKWQPDDIRDDLQEYVASTLDEDGGVLIIDTGIIKKGTTSAGVQRQYSGTAGARISISAR